MGHFKIIEVRADGLSYKLENFHTGVKFIRHCSQLKIYRQRQNDELQQIAENAKEPTEQAPERLEPFILPGFLFPIPPSDASLSPAH